MTVEEIRSLVEGYFRTDLGLTHSRVVRVARGDSGWEVRVEAMEEDQLIRSLGRYPTVWNRSLYDVLVTQTGEVAGFEREEGKLAQ